MVELVGDGSAVDAYSDDPSHVAVVIRLRPPQDCEEDINEIFKAHGNTLTLSDPLSRGRSERTYFFNNVFLPQHGQQFVFEGVARPLIDRLLDGFNSCCFAYGQTGSGKTHSIFGEGNADQRGMLARSLEYLFERIERRGQHKEVGMVVSFTEIYLDQVRDLGRFYTAQKKGTLEASFEVRVPLDARHAPSGGPPPDHLRQSRSKDAPDVYLSQDLAIHESPQGQVYVEGLTQIPVSNLREVLDVVNLGVRMRATYETKLNTQSSRSHTIFTVSIGQKDRNSEDILGSIINFVDLAGSERLAKSRSEGRRFQEAVVINSSLSALGKVVLSLGDPKAAKHVPYRDSKLTRILQNSLGGNSYTTLLATINPAAVNYEESMNSLSFADRCKKVQNKPVLGHIEGQQESQERVIHRLTAEIAQLSHQLQVLVSYKDLGAGGSAKGTSKVEDLTGALTAPATSADASAAESVADVTTLGAAVLPKQGGAASSTSTPDEEMEGLRRIQEQAEQRLEHEREQTQQAEQKADEATLRLEQARQGMVLREQVQKREDQEVRQRNKELETDIAKGKMSLANVSGTVADEQDSERRLIEDNTSRVEQSRDKLTQQIPLAFANEVTEDAMHSCIDNREAERGAVEEQHRQQAILAVQHGHARDVEAVDIQQRQWLQETEVAGEHICKEIEGQRSRHERWHRQVRAELLDAYALVHRLAKVVDGLEAGVPSNLKSDIRPPSLKLGGLRARLKKEGALPDKTFEQFSQGVADLGRRAAKFNHVIQGARENTSGGAAGRDALARPTSKFETTSAASSAPGWDASSARPISKAETTPAASSAPGWDADFFARNFCDFRDGVTADDSSGVPAALQRLDVVRLKALCLSLRRRVRMSTTEQESERTSLRDEVAKDLAAHDRVDQIRQLEKDIADYKVKVRYEEISTRHLEVAFQASTRSGSRPSSLPNSRSTSKHSSRPASAGPRGCMPRPSSAVLSDRMPRPASAGPSARAPQPLSAGPGRPMSATSTLW